MGDIDLNQIARDATGFRGRFYVADGDDGDEIWFASATHGDNREEHRFFPGCEVDDACDPIVRMLNAVPVLLAEVERLRQRLAEANRRLVEARQEIADVRGVLDAYGHDGTVEAAARLRDRMVAAERLAEERLAHANQLQADIEDDRQGRLELRKRYGALEDETMGMFIERLATMAELTGDPARLAWRGVIDPCERCGGAGQIRYGRSCTWRGGMAVSGDYRDVCDLCWSTGDRWRRGVDLRQLRDEESARIAAAALTAVAEAAGVTLHPAGARAFAAKLRELVHPTGRKPPAIEGDLAALMLSIARLIESAASAPQPGRSATLRPSENK